MSFKKLTVLASFLAVGLSLPAPALANPQSPAAPLPPSTVPTLQPSKFPNPNPVYERFQERTSPVGRSPNAILEFPFQPSSSDEVVPITYTPPRYLDEIKPSSQTEAIPNSN